jgi:hypothetical protein
MLGGKPEVSKNCKKLSIEDKSMVIGLELEKRHQQ